LIQSFVTPSGDETCLIPIDTGGTSMRTVGATKDANLAEVKTPNLPRLISLFIAFLGCAVTSLPFLYQLGDPAPLILIGAGVAVVALALFLFFSL
jgi:hypothetical protein